MTDADTLPRSFLYVPATRPDLFPKATLGPADAIVLDLEDAVPLSAKHSARAHVRDWLEQDRSRSAEQWVRVNSDSILADLDAVVRPGLAGLFLAKCSATAMRELAEELERKEIQRQLTPGAVRVVGLLESGAAMVDLTTLSTVPRLTTFGIGEVDLLADLRITRSARAASAIEALRTQVVLHCAAAGLSAPVAPTSTDFRDLETFAETTRLLHDLGFRSRTAIHPAQVPVIHGILTPSEEQVDAARGVLSRFEAADHGVTTDEDGRLIDAAVVRAASETLARAARRPETAE